MATARRRLAAACFVVATVLAAAACGSARSAVPTTLPGTSGTGARTSSSGAPRDPRGLVWILTRSALAQVAALDPAALRVLEAGRIYEIVSDRQRPLAGVTAVVTEDFTSYADLSSAIAAGQLLPGVQAVLYDPEHWSFTPLAEQQNVTTYIGEAATLAHRHGLQIIVTPSLDLVDVLAPGAAGDTVSRFLATGIEQAAAAADVVDVQAQSKEHDPAAYASFVLQAASAVHGRRTAAIVVAGISTNPPSGPVTGAGLAAAMTAVLGQAQGFWLNIPKPGPKCPSCGPPDPLSGTGAIDAVFG